MRRLLAVLVVVLGPAAAAQEGGGFSPYATPFLPLSAEAQGVSEAGAFGPAADPLRLLDNPAVLAGFADGIAVSGDFTPRWLGIDDIQATGAAIAGGVRGTVGGRPASLGVGLAVGAFEIPPVTITDAQGAELGVFDPGTDRVAALGVGGAAEGPVVVRAGLAVRRLTSSAQFSTVGDDDRFTATAADLGLDLTLPIGRWLQPAPDADGYRFDVDLTAGYALRGLGLSDSAPAFDPANSFAASGAVQRTPSAGVRLLTAIVVNAGTPRAFHGSSVELVTGAEDPGAEFFGMSAANVLLGAGDESSQVLTRQGVRVSVAETLVFSLGAMRGASYVARESSGVTVSLGGALRGLGMLIDDDGLHALGRRVDLRYTYARYTFGERGPFDASPAHGLVLRVAR